MAYGPAARYNGTEHVWRFQNGGYMELGQLETAADYQKYQGRSFTLLMVDESGHYSDPALLDRLRSNLRGPKNMPIREVKACEPWRSWPPLACTALRLQSRAMATIPRREKQAAMGVCSVNLLG